MTRLLIWSAIAFSGWGIVSLQAWIMDMLLWQVSWDYIYAPHEFLRSGLRIGLVVGALLAAVATIGARALPTSRSCLRAFAALCCCPLVLALGGAGTMAVGTRFLNSVQNSER